MKNKILSIFMIASMVMSGLIAGQLLFSTPTIAPGPDLPDLTISEQNISFSSSSFFSRVPVTINATIWNVGNADATNVDVNFYEEDNLIGSNTVDLPIWKTHTVDSVVDVTDGGSSIAVDSANGIHISYFNYHLGDLMYAYKPSGGSWTTSTIESFGQVGRYNSIAVDSANGVHISYFHNNNGSLQYAYKPYGGNWAISIIDSEGGNVGRYSSIAVGANDGIHVSYFENLYYDLKYAYKPYGGRWANSTIDTVGNVGTATSIAVDSANGTHISYCDETNDVLKYAYKPNGGNWSNYTLDSIGNGKVFSSIAVDNLFGVHISYYETINDDLKYAFKPNGGSWTYSLVDSNGSVGRSNSLSIDRENGIHISYYDSSNGDLKYAYKPNGGNWANNIIDSESLVGDFNSIAIDNENGIHISYYDKTNDILKYANRDAIQNIQTSISWTPTIGGLRNITVKIDEDNLIEELDETNNEATVTVNVEAGTLWSIDVNPSPVTVELNETQQFNATGYDLYQNEVPIFPTWEVNGGGIIDQNGLFRAISPGTWEVRANYGNISNNSGATVTVVVNSSADTDLDGMLDWWEIFYGFDPFNSSDSMDDLDLDGLTNLEDFLNYTEPNNNDTDNDDMPDGWEVDNSLNPINSTDALFDEDNDGLDNIGEYNHGGDPNDSDSDDDGLPDGWEVSNGLDLTNSSDVNQDPDQDGLSNLQEFLNSSSPNKTDTDGDNLGDGFEVIFSKTKPNDWDTNNNSIGDGLEFIEGQGYLGWIELLPDNWIGMTISWDNYTVYVKTNSSVLEGEFDKDEQKLKITVSGPEGTSGVTEINVPKSLCEPDDIEIMLDGELINYTLTEDDTYYYIHVEYNHSAHELTADFTRLIDEPIESEDDGEGLPVKYLIILVVVIILVIIILLGITRYRNGFQRNEVPDLPPEELSKMLEERYAGGEMTDETYNDIKSLLEKYEDSNDNH